MLMIFEKKTIYVGPNVTRRLENTPKTSKSLTVTGSTANTINILQIDMRNVYIFKDKSIKNGLMVIKMLSDTSTSSNMASTYARNLLQLQLPPKNIFFFAENFENDFFFLNKKRHQKVLFVFNACKSGLKK